MSTAALLRSPIAGIRTVELTSQYEAVLQRFFDANRMYFLAVNGEPAQPNEAHEEIHGELPAGWSFTKKWVIGYLDAQDRLVAMANVVSDLLAMHVWHIGLFLVASARHGTGDAQTLYRGLESWALANGAKWLRLGVVERNARAGRFWDRQGYIQTRTRPGIEMGKLTNTLRVMVKPLAGESIEHYLSLVERDRSEPAMSPSHTLNRLAPGGAYAPF